MSNSQHLDKNPTFTILVTYEQLRSVMIYCNSLLDGYPFPLMYHASLFLVLIKNEVPFNYRMN